MNVMDTIENKQQRTDLPAFIWRTVKVHVKIR
jgi:hypothetical protein